MGLKTALLVFGIMVLMLVMKRWNSRQLARVAQSRKEQLKPIPQKHREHASDEHGTNVKWIVEERGGDRPGGAEPPPD